MRLEAIGSSLQRTLVGYALAASNALGGATAACTSEAGRPQPTAGGAAAGVAAGSGSSGAAGAVAGGAQAGATSSGAGGAMAGADGGSPPYAAAGGDAMPPLLAPDAGGGADGGTPLPKRVLLYHFSTLDIPSLPAQLGFFKNKLSAWQYESDDSVDPTQLSDQNLERYAAVAMINTCFEPFGKGKQDRPQSEVLQRFLQRGGGLFGTHCASVTFQSATPPTLYNQLIGGRGGNGFFDGTSSCRTLAAHPSTTALAAQFPFVGNLDNTDYLATDTVVLVKCKWQATDSKDVNVSWYRGEGAGRVFYPDFAKVDADLSDPVIGPHIVAGLAWVLHAP